MAIRNLDPENIQKDEDWQGNNASFTCPVCGKVFIVSGMIHRGLRECPECGRSKGRVSGGRNNEGTASIEWED